MKEQGVIVDEVDTQTKITSYVSLKLFKYVKFIPTQKMLDNLGDRSVARLVITGLNVLGNKKEWWENNKSHVLRALNNRRAWASSECGKAYLSKLNKITHDVNTAA